MQGFVTADILDFTDINPSAATVSYVNGTLSVTDGTHAASLGIGFAILPVTGGFHVGSDLAAGTKLTWS